MQNSGREFQEEGITNAKALKQNCLVSLGTGLCSRNRANREQWGMRSEQAYRHLDRRSDFIFQV